MHSLTSVPLQKWVGIRSSPPVSPVTAADSPMQPLSLNPQPRAPECDVSPQPHKTSDLAEVPAPEIMACSPGAARARAVPVNLQEALRSQGKALFASYLFCTSGASRGLSCLW